MATVEVFAIGNDKSQQLQLMKTFTRKLSYLGKKIIRLGHTPTEDNPEHIILKECRMYLQWLDGIEMTPEIEQQTKMKFILQYVFQPIGGTHFPEDMVERARDLYKKGEMDNWGANAVADDEDIYEAPSPEEAVVDTIDEIPVVQSEVLSPLFREGGIMYGIMVLRGAKGRKTYRLNPQVPKKSAKVFGHNDIPVGAWFANQLVALHRGAHGSRMGGISGATDVGAYSIVMSDNYDDLDDDRGDTVYYSGSNSHGNKDPLRPAPSSAGTNALKISLHTRQPVRVLRSGGPRTRSHWLPGCGLRYDGLYRVTALRERKNEHGGLYEQFILQREPNQTPLETLRRVSPTPKEKSDLAEFQRG
ncbi:PUA-like domain-containing protein [Annulohypoxylon bovei var. microspora]|nr:PUA-like domain-containing protein [Annulohypoxylon bovei var. microspora]